MGDRVKRAFDIVGSACGLAVTAPLLLGAAAWIKATSKGPVFYRGTRVGLAGRDFRIFKYRTMVVNAEALGGSSTSGDDPRITKVGGFLRRWKIDELPQLINVLVGQMSFVGPRPQVRWAVDTYDDEQRRVLDVRPGITDEASIRFRNEADILAGYEDADAAYLELIHPEKMRLALDYVDNRSLLRDIRIILKTLGVVAGFNVAEAAKEQHEHAQAGS